MAVGDIRRAIMEGDSLDASQIASGVLPVERGGTGNAEGYVRAGKKNGTTIGANATAEGYNTEASGDYSHADGIGTKASGEASSAHGSSTEASGDYAEASGYLTEATGFCASARGHETEAKGYQSDASGLGTVARKLAQHTFGAYNVQDMSSGGYDERGDYIEIVGKGTSSSNRSNARTLDWDGNEWLAGKLTMGTPGTGDSDIVTWANARANFAPSGYGLGSYGGVLTTSDDLDAIKLGGWYTWTTSTAPANTPEEAGGSMMVMPFYGRGSTPAGAVQLVSVFMSNRMYVRNVNSATTGTWGAWQRCDPDAFAAAPTHLSPSASYTPLTSAVTPRISVTVPANKTCIAVARAYSNADASTPTRITIRFDPGGNYSTFGTNLPAYNVLTATALIKTSAATTVTVNVISKGPGGANTGNAYLDIIYF